MKELLVGNAPCSWGTLEHQDQSQSIPFNQMLDELVETGYTGTELGDWGYMPTDPVRLSEELAKRGVVMLGAYVPVAMKNPADARGGTPESGKDGQADCRRGHDAGAIPGAGGRCGHRSCAHQSRRAHPAGRRVEQG